MRLWNLESPKLTGSEEAKWSRLRTETQRTYDAIRRAVNVNDASSSTKAMEWFDAPGTIGYETEYVTGSSYETICTAAPQDMAKVVTGVTVKNNGGGAATVNIFMKTGGLDYRVGQAASVAAGGTAFIPYTYVIYGGRILRGQGNGNTIEYTTHYSLEPRQTGLEPYDVSGGCFPFSTIQNAAGTSVIVLLNEPNQGERHLIRTIALGNHYIVTPTTTLSIREISTANTYDIGVWTYAAYGFNAISHVNEGIIVLKPDTELILQHTSDPLAFAASVHYATVNVTERS